MEKLTNGLELKYKNYSSLLNVYTETWKNNAPIEFSKNTF